MEFDRFRGLHWRLHYTIALCLAVTTALLYANVAGHEFLNFDDLKDVAENPRFAVEATPGALLSHFYEPSGASWLPIYSISLHIDHALYGPNPAAFLLTNLAIHIAAALLLLLVLTKMTREIWPSAFVAFVFALHPLHVESVAWITERKDVLAGFFWMLGFVCYAHYLAAGRSRVWYTLLLGCYALGLMSKSSLVTFPFVLLLLDFWPLRRLPGSLRTALLEKLPLFTLSLAASVVTYMTQYAAGQMQVGKRLSLTARTTNALESYLFYIVDAIWPRGLAPLYPHPYTHADPTGADLALAAGIASVLVAVTALALMAWRARPFLAVGWLWYLLTLAPMIGIVQVGLQARADRYMYIPLTGLAIALAWGVSDLARGSQRRQRIAIAAGAVALAVLAVVSRGQIDHWKDTFTLYERAVAVTENNGYAHEMLGYEYAAIGRNRDAAEHFEEAARVNPGRVQSFFGLAVTSARLGESERAISAYRAGLRLNPNKIRAHGEVGVLLVEAGRAEEAVPHLTRALDALPDDPTFNEALERARAAIPGQEPNFP